MTRKMIAALQVSFDGFTQGSDHGEPEWVDSWADAFELIPDVDAFVQGAGMYPGYAMFWSTIEANPRVQGPYASRVPYEREVAYAQRAANTPHYVLSTKLDSVAWPPTARIVRDLGELRVLKEQAGKNIYVVGGPTLFTSLLQAGLIDELMLIVHPLLLGTGKPLFEGVHKRRQLKLLGAEQTAAGHALLKFGT